MPIFDPASLAQASQDVPLSTPPAPPQSKPSLWGPALMTAGGNAADAASTWWALHNIPGAREGNPLLPGGAASIMGLKAALTVPEIYLEKKLNDSGHPTMSKVLGAALGGLGGAMAYRNTHLQ